jgi:hypothetical protein
MPSLPPSHALYQPKRAVLYETAPLKALLNTAKAKITFSNHVNIHFSQEYSPFILLKTRLEEREKLTYCSQNVHKTLFHWATIVL